MTAPANASAVHGVENLLFFTLLQLVVILLAARVAGRLARWLGQPRAVGEIVAGLALGPSLLGALAPAAFNWLFRSQSGAPISIMSQIGLILLMFQIGLEFDFSHLRERSSRRLVLLVTIAGIAAPFLLGLLFATSSATQLAAGINPVGYALFIATAFSITAVPILGRIMIEYDLTRTRIGTITIAAAAINDAVGWTILAFISAIVTAQFTGARAMLQLGGLALYVIACWFVVRPGLRWLLQRFSITQAGLSQDLLAALLVVIFASALATSQLGIFAIFGGFMVGVLLHDQHELVAAWKGKAADLVTVFFLPIFFTYTGLRTEIGSLNTPALWGWCLALIALAVLGKFGGCYLAARAGGLSADESRNVAIMMNTRALMELVVVNIGYDLGVIPPSVFTMLVLMAITSTLMTAPGLRAWLPSIGHRIPERRDA